jgi:putative hydrolase of the HAD superfamily
MQDGSQPRVVVCDLDGVVRRFDVTPQATVDAEHGLPEGTIAALAFDPERLIPAITGAVRDEEWRGGDQQGAEPSAPRRRRGRGGGRLVGLPRCTG